MRNIYALSLNYFVSAICPLGYGSKEDDVPGMGSDLGSDLTLTREECARKCSEKDECLSFEHSYTEGKCSLNRVAEPTQGPYKDYAFCTKQGKLF